MASGVFSSSASALSSLPSPLTILMQLTISSATIGFTPSSSLARLGALPLISACVYSILTNAKAQMRPRWASLLGGASFMFLLQYSDLGLVRRWNYQDRGPAAPPESPTRREEYEKGGRSSVSPTSGTRTSEHHSIWAKFRWAWSSMFALRHVNTKYEARNTPPFSNSDPAWTPFKARFLVKEGALALLCYLLLDLMAQRAPSPSAAQLFDTSLIPLFRRLGEITLPQLRLRALSIAGFTVTFWALIRGYAAAAGTVTVALGICEPRDWRPPFGNLTEAYSIQNLWGKVWHQNLRSLLTSHAANITYSVLHLPRGTFVARLCSILVSFTLSGVMHSCAGIAAGMSPGQLNVLHFFITQALGVAIEDLVRLAYLKARGQEVKKQEIEHPSLVNRIVGYMWVAAFMTWSGPVWLYPQASKPAPPGTNSTFLPYSVIKALKMGDISAG